MVPPPATTPHGGGTTSTSAHASSSSSSSLVAAGPLLDVYKKVTIVRKPTDVVVYEDSEGNLQRITDFSDLFANTGPQTSKPTSAHKTASDIPTPRITVVDTYETDYPPTYQIPRSYIRNRTLTVEEVESTIEYNVDEEDEEWLNANLKFGPKATGLSCTRSSSPEPSSGMITSGGAGSGSSGSANKKSSKKSSKSRTSAGGDAAESAGPSTTGVDLPSQSESTLSAEKEADSLEASKKGDDKEMHVDVENDPDEDDEEDDDILSLLLHRRKRPPRLTLAMFEQMIDALEKATGFETIVTTSQAERLLITKMPQLIHMFGSAHTANGGPAGGTGASSSTSAEGTTSKAATGNGSNDQQKQKRNKQQQQQPQNDNEHQQQQQQQRQQRAKQRLKDQKKKANGGGGITVRVVIGDVYNYWMQKRSRLKKPLLRQYWPVTATNDTNPHSVFRPREKEKYKLRKKRQNDLDAYRKMKQLRVDFEKLRNIVDLIRRRERLQLSMLDMRFDYVEQRIYDTVDTSGWNRISERLGRPQIDEQLNVPRYYDTQHLQQQASGDRSGSGRRKKRKRSGGAAGGSDSRASSPLPGSMDATSGVGGDGGENFPQVEGAMADALLAATAPMASTVAGQDNGLPAPMFLHPLQSRESYTTSWDNAVPFVSSYVDSHPVPTFRFRHRPRVGRGGRIVVDRMPVPPHPTIPTVTVFTAGHDLPRSGGDVKPATTLLELLPKPLDYTSLTRRIEEISAAALSDDDDVGAAGGGATATGASIVSSASSHGMTAGAGAGSGGNTSGGDAEENDGEEVIVSLEEWLDTDEQLWGEERFAVGPV